MSQVEQSKLLSTLSAAPAQAVTTFADNLMGKLPEVSVLENRTGLVMVPYTDTRKGNTFHMGEALVAEARVKMDGSDKEGYGACMGRDTKHALAIAILDAANQSELEQDAIDQFVKQQSAVQQAEEEELLKKVESTRVEMETY